jgi:CRP-like cAMP-binding protein
MAKSRPQSPLTANRLLNLLPRDEYERLRPKLRSVELPVKQVLMRAQKPFEYVYFPARAMVSALTVMADGATIEVGCVGSEGLAGSSAVLGVLTSPHQNIVQVPGEALRMDAGELAQACSCDGRLRQLMVQYHAFFFSQVSQSVACNGLHSVSQRCCRWLLITHNGAQSDRLPLTHEFLAMMLGVRRVSVTLVLQPLQEQGLIRGGRGTITILDRRGLEIAACECYQRVKDEYARLLGVKDS